MKARTFVAGCLTAQAMMQAQTSVDLRTQARNVDFSSAGSTRPVKTGSSLPAGCVSGEMFFLSSAPAGENLYGCTGANTWSVMGSRAPGGGTGLSSLGGQTGATQMFANDSNVSITSAANTHTLGWSGTLAASRGGTGHGAFVNGDLLYASGVSALSRLAIGSNGQCLIVSGGAPAWGPCGSSGTGGGGGITTIGGQSGSSQTFANDVNLTITSAANTHTLGWSGTLSKPRQNPATVYTDQANTWSAGVQDFSAAGSFRGKTGASDPPTCAPGDLFFNTAQNVQMACTQPNVWTPLRAVAPGAGVTLAHSGSTTTVSADTAVMLSQATNQANTSKYCADNGSTDTYTCNVTPALTTYTTGMFDIFRPNTRNTGAATKDISGVGARNIKLADGTTDPPDNTLLGGRFYATVYDGSAWQTMPSIVSGGNVSGILPADNGGTGLNSSTSTGVPRLTSGTWSFDAGFSHLSNVAHNHQDAAGGGQLNASSVFSAGIVPAARLGSGTASASTFLRGDQTWVTISGSGSGSGSGVPNPSVNGIAVCTGTNCSSSAARTIAGTASEITATNGDGVSGNPTLAIASNFDISGKTSTKPVKTGTTMPGTCAVGELFYKTDATAGQNLYGCTSTNNWAVLGDGTGSGSFGETSLAGLVNNQTLWNGTQASRTLTAGLSGATDPAITFSDNSVSLNVPMSAPRFVVTGSGGEAGFLEFTQGTACTPSANSVCEHAPASIPTAYRIVKPSSVGTTGVVKVAVSGPVATYSHAAISTTDVSPILRTRQAHFKYWGSGAGSILQDADDELSIFNNQLGSGITITKVTCEADAGTPTIQLQRDDGTPTNMLSSNLTCATSPASTTSFVSGENAIPDGYRVDAHIVAAGGTAHWVAVTITYTVD